MRNTETKAVSITAVQSKTLVKNLFRAAISSIAYIRNMFATDCFEIGSMGSTRYPRIIGTKKEEARHLIDWLERGVFDALQKDYLEVVLLEVYSNTAGNGARGSGKGNGELLECFSFKVTYQNGIAGLQVSGAAGPISDTLPSKDDIKRNTSAVLKSLVSLTYTMKPLPRNRIISMKLLYTNDTPAEYEPPLFTKSLMSDFCWFEETPLSNAAGVVSTPYHGLSMKISVKATDDNKNSFSLKQSPGQNIVLETDMNKEGSDRVKTEKDEIIDDNPQGEMQTIEMEDINVRNDSNPRSSDDEFEMPVRMKQMSLKEKKSGSNNSKRKRVKILPEELFKEKKARKTSEAESVIAQKNRNMKHPRNYPGN